MISNKIRNKIKILLLSLRWKWINNGVDVIILMNQSMTWIEWWFLLAFSNEINVKWQKKLSASSPLDTRVVCNK